VTHDRARPLHVFDADKVAGNIHARMAKSGEQLAALDGKTYTLDETMCVIADDSGAVGIGGIIGGEPTGCSDETVNVCCPASSLRPSSSPNSAAARRMRSSLPARSARPIRLSTSHSAR
jgi:phenylalanyl-tRNA synthetase beta chain